MVGDFSTILRADQILDDLAKTATVLGESGPDTMYGMVSFHTDPETGEVLLFVDGRWVKEFPPSMRVRIAQQIAGDIFHGVGHGFGSESPSAY